MGFSLFFLAMSGTPQHPQANFFHGIFDGIVRADTATSKKYHAMNFGVVMVSKITNMLILKEI